MESQGYGIANRPDAARLSRAHRRLNATVWELFELVVELDTDHARARNAMTDAVAWLQYDLGITARTARVWVRAAHALVDLPVTAEAFRAGDLSLDEVLVLCRYATPDNEAQLVELTREVEVEDLAAEIRDLLGAASQPKPNRDVPMARFWWDQNVLQVRGSIPGADGVLVETTLLRLGAQAPLDPQSGLFRSGEQRHGEALVQLASESTAQDRDHDRATVVLHLDLDHLTSTDPDAVFNLGGTTYTASELLRLTCDGRIQPAIDHGGVTVGIGRVSRQIPAWLRRILSDRDGGCRFPGCHRSRWTHAHHIVHWADGGSTNLDNLITLCGWHHRLIHKQGWTLEGNPNGGVTFLDQWGQAHQPARMIEPDWQDRLVEQITTTYTPHSLKLATANSPP